MKRINRRAGRSNRRQGLRLDYKLVGSGWALATLTIGRKSIPMVVSYLHDSLGQLAAAIEALGKRAKAAKAVFMAEPGEHQVMFERAAGSNVAIDVLWYADWRSWGMYDGPGVSRLKGTVPLAELHEQVVSVLGKLLARHGAAGYRKQWHEHDFPLAIYRRLGGTESPRRKPKIRRRRRRRS